jgi:hypothetical protein
MVEATGTARDIVPLMIGEMLSYGKEELGWEETDAEEIRADALMGMGEMNDVAALVVRIAALVTDLIEDNEEITWDEWGFSSLPPSIRKDVVNRLLDLTPESAADVLRQLETILGRAGERLTEDLLPILDCTTRELLKKNS